MKAKTKKPEYEYKAHKNKYFGFYIIYLRRKLYTGNRIFIIKK